MLLVGRCAGTAGFRVFCLREGRKNRNFFWFGAVFSGREKSGVGAFLCREDGFRAER